MHLLHHVQGALRAQALGQQRLEVFRLLRRRHHRLQLEGRLQEGFVGVSRILAEEEHRVHVRGAVLIQREQESQRRRAGQPFRSPLVENAVDGIVLQRRLVPLHRANCAEHIAEGPVGIFIVDLSVHVPPAHVQVVVHQQNQPVVRRLGILHGLHIRMLGPDARDQLCEQLLHGILVLQRRVPNPQQQVVLRRTADGRQGLPHLARQHLFEKVHVFLVFLLIQRRHGKRKAGDRVAEVVHIASPDQGGIALIRIQPPFDF